MTQSRDSAAGGFCNFNSYPLLARTGETLSLFVLKRRGSSREENLFFHPEYPFRYPFRLIPARATERALVRRSMSRVRALYLAWTAVSLQTNDEERRYELG